LTAIQIRLCESFLASLMSLGILTLSAASLAQTPNSPDAVATFRHITPEMNKRCRASLAALQPSVRQWIRQQGQIEAHHPAHDQAALEAAIRERFGKNLPAAEVSELLFDVLMTSFAPQYNSLLQVREELQAQTAAQQALRDTISKVSASAVAPNSAAGAKANINEPCNTAGCRTLAQSAAQLASRSVHTSHPLRYNLSDNFTYAQAQQALQQMQQDLDSLNDISQAQQLKLQMAEQQWSQMMDIISNVMKTMNDTSSSILQNLK
jgi:type III secretion apparatus needle protein